MKRYDEYKDSEISWIGEIPKHWEISKIRSILALSKEKTDDPDAVLLSLSQYTGIRLKKDCNKVGMFEAENTIGYNIIHKGQFVMNIMLAWNGSYAISNFDGVISPSYCVFNFIKNCNRYFFNYLLRLQSYAKAFKTLSKGLIDSRLRLYPDYFRTFPIIIPPLSEQHSIVSYLDAKVNKIDTYISTTEKKIAALDELKQVIIADAVTHGIHSNVAMKDSGIKWIGKIPEHWKKLRAKNMFERQFREVHEEDEVVTCFRNGQVTLRKNRRTEGFTESLKEIGYQGIRIGDLVIHQMDAFAGAIGVSDSNGKGTPVYICCLPKGNYNVNYYAYLLREMARTGFIKSLYRGIRERSSDFRFDTFASQWLPVLPPSEQQEIVTYIDRKVAQIDKMRNAEFSQIEKLKEYKQRLISDVVTGKMKV